MSKSSIPETREAMSLGIRAGKALLRTENALAEIRMTSSVSDFNTVAHLRAARVELNKLAKEISNIVDHLEKQVNSA